MLKRLFTCDSGASAVEYGVIASLIAVAIIVAVGTLGERLAEVFNGITGRLKTINP